MPKDVPDRIILLSIFNDMVLNKTSNEQMCISTAQQVADFSKDSKPSHWCRFSKGFKQGLCRHIWPGSEQSWNFDTIAIPEKITDIFARSENPVFPADGTCEERNVEIQSRNATIHFTSDPENMQMLMKLTLSCNQLYMFLSVAQTASQSSLMP